MADLHITEYGDTRKAPSGNAQIALEPALANQQKTIGAEAQSSAFNAKTTLVRLYAAADCYVAFGADPTASAASTFLPSGTIEYFGVTAGDKVSVHDGVT